jgi:methionyl aminopeptidase
VSIKTQKEVEILRAGGKRLAHILQIVGEAAKDGVSTEELNTLCEILIREGGDIPAFLGYKPEVASRPFPASMCISINDVVVHGIPNEHPKILKDGDIVSLDAGLIHQKLVTDATVTVGVGNIDRKAKELIRVTEQALEKGIAISRAGNYIGDIGYAIEEFVKKSGFGVVRELGGHGVGYSVHEEPIIPNVGPPKTGPKLEPGMVLAIEPIVTEGSSTVVFLKDGYTVVTKDKSRSAQVEHTIVVTEGEAEILTKV